MPCGAQNAAAELVISGGGEGRRGEDRHDLAAREDAVLCFDRAELDLHLAARAGVADGLAVDILAQALADGLSAFGFCGIGLRGQSAADARDGGWPQVGHLGGPGDPGGQDCAQGVLVPDVPDGELFREISGRVLFAHGRFREPGLIGGGERPRFEESPPCCRHRRRDR